MEKFGWAVIGCGSIADTVASQMLESDTGRIVSAWNRTHSRAEDFVKKFCGRAYETAEDALSAEGVNAVYIATTHNVHADYAKLAIDLGVPVLCEKPVTVNGKQLEEVLEAAKKNNVYFAEAMWTWHSPLSLKVKEWVKSGAIGEIRHVKAKYAYPISKMSHSKRLTSPSLAGGALLDIGIYPIRYIYELFGKPDKIMCEGKLSGGVDTEERIKMTYGGFDADIFVSMERFRGEKIVIEGTEGSIVLPFFHNPGKVILKGKENKIFKDREPLYGLELKHTVEDVLSGRKESAYCPLKSTVEVMELMDECRRQMGLLYPFENNI